MNRGLMLMFGFILIAIITWLVLLTIVGGRACPEQLPEKYYYCVMDEDCYFHPKYNCINYEPLDCVVKEDLSARQQAGDLIECLCVSNRCFTRVRSATEERVERPPTERVEVNITTRDNVSDIFSSLN